MTSTLFWDDVLELMIASLRSVTAVDGSNWETTDKKKKLFRVVDRYLGEFAPDEAVLQAGIAGRMPAVLMAFAGEDVISTTVGFKRDKLKARFMAIVAVDSVKSREDRANIYQLVQQVRNRIIGRRIEPDSNGQPWMGALSYTGLVEVMWRPSSFALGVKMETIYRSDYSIEMTERSPAPAVVPTPSGGATTWGYATVAESESGVLSDLSDETITRAGAAVLGGAAANQVTPGASAEATTHHVYRTTAPVGVPLGKIGECAPGGAVIDLGAPASAAVPSEPTGTSYEPLRRLRGSFTSSGVTVVGTDKVIQ